MWARTCAVWCWLMHGSYGQGEGTNGGRLRVFSITRAPWRVLLQACQKSQRVQLRAAQEAQHTRTCTHTHTHKYIHTPTVARSCVCVAMSSLSLSKSLSLSLSLWVCRRVSQRVVMPCSRAETKTRGNPDRGTRVPAVHSTHPAAPACSLCDSTASHSHGAAGRERNSKKCRP